MSWHWIVDWLKSIHWLQVAPLLGILGGVFVFLLWERKKKNLEIEKLRLEIAELRRKEAVLHRPTLEEIRAVLNIIEPLGKRRLRLGDAVDLVDEFIRDLYLLLRTWVTDRQHEHEAGLDAKQSDLKVLLDGQEGIHEENQSSRAVNLHSLTLRWRSVKPEMYSRLPDQAIQSIDSLLRSTGREVAE